MKRLLLTLPFLFLVFSCSDSPNRGRRLSTFPTPTIDPSDHNALMEALDAANPDWNWIHATQPGAGSSFINSQLSDTVIMANGRTSQLELNVVSGSAISIFMRVQGAQSYFEILEDPDGKMAPSVRFRTLREQLHFLQASKEEKIALAEQYQRRNPGSYLMDVHIPASIMPGTFNIELAIIDDQGTLSNIITRTIRVIQLGGSGSEAQLIVSRAWLWDEINEYLNGNLEFSYKACPPADTITTIVYCPPDYQTSMQVTAIESWCEHLILDFDPMGDFVFNDAYSYTYVNPFPDIDCNDYLETGTDSFEFTGAWSYDENARVMLIVYDGFYDEDLGYYFQPESFELIVHSVSSTELWLREYDEYSGDIWHYDYLFIPSN